MTSLGAPDWFANPRQRGWRCPAVPGEVLAFHRLLDGYRRTPLVELPAVAAELGVGRVFAKDESSRLGLPAFKALGASWAMHRVLRGDGGVLSAAVPGSGAGDPITFVTATDGNHGRAVARSARLLGHRAAIFIPDGVHADAVAAIRGEGASVEVVGGSYDDAVTAAAAAAHAPGAVLLQDTAWPGYEDVPAWIVEGYATLFAEIDEELGERLGEQGLAAPDLVVVPVGVGSLAQAAVAHYRSRPDPDATALLTVEPVAAACVLASLRAGRPVPVSTTVTAMAGLNCGTVSSLAWPLLRDGVDGAVSVTDANAAAARAALRDGGVDAGPCGCASLAGARGAVAVGAGNVGTTERREALRIGPASTMVLIVTEGAAANPTGG